MYSFRDTITEFADLFCVFIPVSPQSAFIFVNFPTWNLQQELFLINLKVFENKTWTFFQTADCFWEQHLVSISKRGLLPSTGMNYCCFLHDVAKIQTPKLSVLLRFSFMMYKGSSKIIFIQIFTSKGSLVLSMLECLSIYNAAQRAVMKVKKEAYCNFAYLNSSCIRKSITLKFMNYLRNIIMLL